MVKEEKIRVILGSDHAGYEIKRRVEEFLKENGVEYEDIGPEKLDMDDDYTDYAFKVSEKVAGNKSYRGILVCGTGTGMVIAANKVKGIRAVAAYDDYTAIKSREHNDANVLCLRGVDFPFEEIKQIVEVWLETPFSGIERHKRRIKKIEKYEK